MVGNEPDYGDVYKSILNYLEFLIEYNIALDGETTFFMDAVNYFKDNFNENTIKSSKEVKGIKYVVRKVKELNMEQYTVASCFRGDVYGETTIIELHIDKNEVEEAIGDYPVYAPEHGYDPDDDNFIPAPNDTVYIPENPSEKDDELPKTGEETNRFAVWLSTAVVLGIVWLGSMLLIDREKKKMSKR